MRLLLPIDVHYCHDAIWFDVLSGAIGDSRTPVLHFCHCNMGAATTGIWESVRSKLEGATELFVPQRSGVVSINTAQNISTRVAIAQRTIIIVERQHTNSKLITRNYKKTPKITAQSVAYSAIKLVHESRTPAT